MGSPNRQTALRCDRLWTLAQQGNADVTMSETLRFRECMVCPEARLLLRREQAINIGGRAFDLLVVLLRNRGRVVSKAEIFRYVWPDTQVDESNLRFQMTSLRSALDEDRDLIKTIPGRGYLFVTECSTYERAASGPPNSGFQAIEEPRSFRKIDLTDKQYIGAQRRRVVAIIDDNTEIREALEGFFQSVGLEVETFSSVQEYNGRDWSFQPSCLVLDVFLPGENGLDFQAQLRRSGLNVPVVFITAHADVHMGVQAMKAGAFDFLTKPVRHQDLLDVVRLASSVSSSENS